MTTSNITGQTVAANITHWRKSQGISLARLSQRLSELTGREYLATTLSAIERSKRRVDVDDLVAFAAALGVSPATLLMPPAEDADTELASTVGTHSAGVLWQWLIGLVGLDGDADDLSFRFRSSPRFMVTTSPLDWTDPQIQAVADAVAERIQKGNTDGNN